MYCLELTIIILHSECINFNWYTVLLLQLFKIIFFFSCKLVCKFKAHKRCAIKAPSNCKWTTLSSVGKDIIEDEDIVSISHFEVLMIQNKLIDYDVI